MAEFEETRDRIEDSVEFGLTQVMLFFQRKIREITPRHLDRLPNNINRKDGGTPTRTSGRAPVQIGGNWYEGVTGNLKRSIIYQKFSEISFAIGVAIGPANKYAAAHEFGTVFIPPRSYLRKGIFDNISEAQREFDRAVTTYNR